MERRFRGILSGGGALRGKHRASAQDAADEAAEAAGDEAAEEAADTADEASTPPTEEEDDIRSVAKRLGLKVALYAAVLIVVLTFVIGIHQVHDNDMYPSLRDGDLVITYKLGGYFTGDAVVYEADGGTHYGRVCAVAGDEVLITEDGYYAINGTIPVERIFYPTEPRPEATGVTYPYRVEEGTVFVMGDMRQQAQDSRTFGAIPLDRIQGKVVLVLFRGREI